MEVVEVDLLHVEELSLFHRCYLYTSDLRIWHNLGFLGYTMYHLVLHRYMWTMQLYQLVPSYKTHLA